MPDRPERPLAFVDLLTTGSTATRDRVIEIAIITWDGEGSTRWSQRIHPDTHLPGLRESPPGEAPRFADMAQDLAARLAGHVLVAHNARVDYAFLKNEFRRCGLDFRAPVLCTLKYSRALFPEQPAHDLNSLIARHGLTVPSQHRALNHAQAIFDFWRKMETMFPAGKRLALQKALLARPALPPHVDAEQVDEIPEDPGVYLFYGENDLPIYVGKANQLRQRVLSHFSSDHALAKELAISQQVRRIEWQVCAGEVDALITEARLIKSMQPTLNRQLRRTRDLCAWQLRDDEQGRCQPVLVHARDLDFGRQPGLYGLFRSAKEAKSALLEIARNAELCPVVLGLEQGRPGKACFARQLRRCRGACTGEESLQAHTQRLTDALASLRLQAWPFTGPALLPEGESIHLIDAWCHLGTARSDTDLRALLKNGRPSFDRDTYHILVKHAHRMRPLPTDLIDAVRVDATT